MRTEKRIEHVCFGGGINVALEITDDERNGQKLGTAIKAGEKIVSESTEHIEAEDAATMTFDFGAVRKDRIQGLVWHKDAFTSQVCRVNFAASRAEGRAE